MKPIVLLVRHGHPDTAGDRLVGRTPGIPLSERGRAQATEVGRRLAVLKPTSVTSSPIDRCHETAELVAAESSKAVATDQRLTEIDFGEWQGRTYSSLTKKPLWRDIQSTPSKVTFPGGESFTTAQARAVEAVNDIAARRRGIHVICSHADVIKLVVAHFAGTHIDHFQRIVVSHASVSAIALGDSMPRVLCVGDTGLRASDLIPGLGK